MGTSLFKIGNHSIIFKGRQFGELTAEIKSVLDQIVLPNSEFLRRYALNWNWDNPRMVREIKTKRDWTFREENEFYSFEEDKTIDFYGPFGLSLTFEENYIKIGDPSFRYRQWFELESDVYRDEWRKYFKQIVNAFGGDKLAYLADNSHYLESYIDYEGSFEEMEIALIEKYGQTKATFKEVADNFDNSYFVDDFKSIDWSKTLALEKSFVEPDETSSTSFDLEFYSNIENLKQLNFNDEVLLHKLIEGKICFYHLTRIDGLLCEHKGVVGSQGSLELKLDQYAPFTFDALVEKIKMEGYYRNEKIFKIKLKSWNNIQSWQDVFNEYETEMLWTGIGKSGGSSLGGKEWEEWYYAVDEELAIKLFLEISNKHNVTGEIEFYRKDPSNMEDEVRIN